MSGIGFVALLLIINFNMFLTNKNWRVQEKAFYNSTPLQRNMMRLGLVCLALFSVWLSFGRFLTYQVTGGPRAQIAFSNYIFTSKLSFSETLYR